MPLVLPNIWDASSAPIVEEAGIPVVATSSGAIAGVLGMQDDDSSDPDVIFDFVTRIADSVACPVTADLEAGFGLARRGGLSIGELTTLGVRRISFASGLFQLVSDQLRAAVHRLAEAPSTDALWQGLPSRSD